MFQEVIGIVAFDNLSFNALKELNKHSNLSFKIITIHNFIKINLDFWDVNNIKDIEIYRNTKTLEYLYSKLEGVDKVFCITNENLTNKALAIEVKRALTKLNKTVSVLSINLSNVNIENLKESLRNPFALDLNDLYKFVRYKSIDIVTGIMIPKLTKNVMGEKIEASRVLTPFFIYIYKQYLNKNITSNTTYNLQKIIVDNNIEKIMLNEKEMTPLYSFGKIINIQKNFEITKYLQVISNYYWGNKIKNKYIPLVSFNINEETKLKIKDILEKYGMSFIDRETNNNQIFLINFDNLPNNKGVNKLIYQILLIKTLLYFTEVKYNKEKLEYNNGKSLIYKNLILNNEFLSYLNNYFSVEKWLIDTVFNETPKYKKIKEKKDEIDLNYIINNEDILNEIGVYDYNLNYYLNKINDNGLFVLFNNKIIFNDKSIKYYNLLEKDFKFLMENKLNKEVNNLVSKINNKDDMNKYVKQFIINFHKLTYLLDKPTLKQINKLNTYIDVPEEAYLFKDKAKEYISSMTEDTLPSQKQISYSKEICDKLKIEVPEDIISSKKKLNKWIFAQKKKIILKPTTGMINFAIKLSKEYRVNISDGVLDNFFETKKFISSLISNDY